MHVTTLSLHTDPKKKKKEESAHFWLWPLLLALLLLVPCPALALPGSGQHEGNKCQTLMKKIFSFSDKNKIPKHWKFHRSVSAHEDSRLWELLIIQLSSNHLKTNLSRIPVPSSAEFTSHYLLASAALSPLALLTCLNLGGIKSGTAPDLFHEKSGLICYTF